MNTQENVKKFEGLLSQVDREGMPQLLEYIRDKSDFYTAPASTRISTITHANIPRAALTRPARTGITSGRRLWTRK